MLRTLFFLLILSIGVTACSGQDDEATDKTHVWQSQTDALQQAGQLRDQTNAETERQQQQYDQLEQESRSQ